ncbi:MAG: bifunctional 3-deoxy-7-phosphoheptulonate synthase/chorismate mutase type II [Bacteroidales bacterium]
MDIAPLSFPDIEKSRPLVLAGPCSAETEEQVLETARRLVACGIRIFRAGIWKPRTKPGSFEGVGKDGLKWLREVKQETGMYTSTEVANARHVNEALKAGIDILWLGARTTANPFVVQEIADALLGVEIKVLVKNPVNPDIELWIGAMERLQISGIRQIAAVHRGFGSYEKGLFRNLPQWHIPIELKRRLPGLTLICDPSHIGGRSELILPISQQAMDLGFDGLMIESHFEPHNALSDKEQQITPEFLKNLLNSLVIRETSDSSESLNELRREIDEIDERLLDLISMRMSVAREIGRYKKQNNMPVLQPKRYEHLVTERLSQALGLELDEKFVELILEAIHEESVRQQIAVFNKD